MNTKLSRCTPVDLGVITSFKASRRKEGWTMERERRGEGKEEDEEASRLALRILSPSSSTLYENTCV